MALDLRHALQAIATVFLKAENESNEMLEQNLMALGMEMSEAKQWSLLMPIAFARAAYRFQLPELNDPQNQYVECHIGEQPPNVLRITQLAPYELAKSWATDCGQMDMISSPEYNAIVRRSVEFEAIQSLRTGAIQTLPPLILHF